MSISRYLTCTGVRTHTHPRAHACVLDTIHDCYKSFPVSRTCACAHTSSSTFTHARTHARAPTHIHSHTRINTNTETHTHPHTHTHTHARASVHAHTPTHTQVPGSLSNSNSNEDGQLEDPTLVPANTNAHQTPNTVNTCTGMHTKPRTHGKDNCRTKPDSALPMVYTRARTQVHAYPHLHTYTYRITAVSTTGKRPCWTRSTRFRCAASPGTCCIVRMRRPLSHGAWPSFRLSSPSATGNLVCC